MIRFEVGERAKVINTCSAPIRIGDIVTIVGAEDSLYTPGRQSFIIRPDYGTDTWHSNSESLAKVADSPSVEGSPPGVFNFISDNPTAIVAEDGVVKEAVEYLPTDVLLQCGTVMGFGLQKYYADKWLKEPTSVRKRIGSALRHVYKHLNGETLDPESGAPHLCHAIVQLMMSQGYTNRGIK